MNHDVFLVGYTMRTHRYCFTRWVGRDNHVQVDAVESCHHKNDPQEGVNIAGGPRNKGLVENPTPHWKAR